MPMQLHMTIEGMKQGPIDGPSKIKGREKSFEVLALNHMLTVPYEPRTGALSGIREHHPLVTLKTVDEASPKLYRATATGEHITVEIKWYRPHPDGGAAEQHYFTTKLENAKIISIAPHMQSLQNGGSASTGHMEELSF